MRGHGGGSGQGGPRKHPDDLIREAYAGKRLSKEQFERVVEHVARAGFDPNGSRKVRQRHEGIRWKGRLLWTGQGQRLPTAEEHYLTHVYAYGEWPEGTSEQRYLDSIKEVVRDRRSRFFVGLYQGDSYSSRSCGGHETSKGRRGTTTYW